MLYFQKKIIIIKKNGKNINNFSYYKNNNLNKKFKFIYLIRYFFILKKKRKIFKFTGLIIKNRKFFFKIRVKLNREIFFLNFFIFNPFLITFRIKNQKYLFFFLYKKMFINLLIEVLSSQYVFKKYFFYKKTKYKFR